jgi:hypothetical protein
MSSDKLNMLLNELLNKQIPNIHSSKKLHFNDLKRISKYINKSIFDDDNCCIWAGYITNERNISKGTYINFYFRKKKVALHRLLYINFIDDLDDNDYLKFNCNNKGKCCNVNHMKKFKYCNVEQNNERNNEQNLKLNHEETKNNDDELSDDLFITFD